MPFSYSLHDKWEGVWEIRGNSHRNGDRMIIIFSEKECELTEGRTLEQFTLTAEPQNNLRAHWGMRSHGKAQRYYIGNLLHSKNYDEIQWSEMRKNRKGDKWIRIDLDPSAYLDKCRNNKHNRAKYHHKPQKRGKNKRIMQKKAEKYSLQQVSSPKQKYVLTKKSSTNNSASKPQINDPAIVDMIEYNNKDKAPKYQTEHRPLKSNQFYVDRYPKPRRTTLRHDQVHEFRQRNKDKRSYKNKQQIYQVKGSKNKATVLDDYFSNSSGDRKYKKKEQQLKRRRNRHRFSKYLSKQEADKILEETKTFKNAVIYIGDISVSRFNPSVSFVSVDGLERDIRVSGFVDRNRAFHGDRVVVSIYPEIEWLSAIKPEIKEFQDRLDERDRLDRVKNEEEFEEDDDDIILDGYNASSSSSASEGIEIVSDNKPTDNEPDDEAEIIYLDDSDDDKKNKENEEDKGDKEEEEEKEKKENETEEEKEKDLNKKSDRRKRRRMEDLVDRKSMTAYDFYLFLKDVESDFEEFKNKWPSIDLMDDKHPRRGYIDQVIDKCFGSPPSLALREFKWSNPQQHVDKIARGRVIGIYLTKKSNKDMIPGFLQPLMETSHGEIDRRWALFTPSDKRYPKAKFPMRELPSSMKQLFLDFEAEEIEIIQEYENRMYDLRKQGLQRKMNSIKKRHNIYKDKLRLMFFNMQFETRWPHHSSTPICHLQQELGKRGAIDVETNVILSRHNISWRQTFNKEIEDYVSKFTITEEDYAERKDCRSLRVFTIDPTSARDFDDALSIEPLNEKDERGLSLYRVGIHIADVTHFVLPGSIVDIEAARRATSVYLVDRCIPMLPHHLCQNLCSLNPNVDRLAYSVFAIMNSQGLLVIRDKESPWFGKTVIRSRARLNYETAHWMLIDRVTGDTPLSELDECCFIADDTQLSDIVSDTKIFWQIASQMRERRFAAGSVQFFRPHIRFRLDKEDQHKALVFGPEILLWSNHLIEEMMLLANQLVANQLAKNIKEHSLIRKHPPPLKEKGMKLELICRSQGLQLLYDTPKQLNESLQKMQQTTYGGINAAKVINALLAQTMQRAQYIVIEDQPMIEWKHWALNFPLYTHFTSPIRRYADVIVHRLLSYTIASDNCEELPSIHKMKSQCLVCNERNSAAHFAEIESQNVHLCLVLIDRPVIVDALLIDLYNTMFILVVPGLGIDVRVNINDAIQESKGKIVSIKKEFELPDSVLNVEWKSGEMEQFKLFDKIRIKLSSQLKIPISLVTKILDPNQRKRSKAANADAIQKEEEDEEKRNNGVHNEDIIDEKTPPVAMTLDSQLKVGTCDYYASHYD